MDYNQTEARTMRLLELSIKLHSYHEVEENGVKASNLAGNSLPPNPSAESSQVNVLEEINSLATKPLEIKKLTLAYDNGVFQVVNNDELYPLNEITFLKLEDFLITATSVEQKNLFDLPQENKKYFPEQQLIQNKKNISQPENYAINDLVEDQKLAMPMIPTSQRHEDPLLFLLQKGQLQTNPISRTTVLQDKPVSNHDLPLAEWRLYERQVVAEPNTASSYLASEEKNVFGDGNAGNILADLGISKANQALPSKSNDNSFDTLLTQKASFTNTKRNWQQVNTQANNLLAVVKNNNSVGLVKKLRHLLALKP